MSIILVICLSLVPLIVCLRLLYLLIVFLEEIVREVKLIVELIFPFIVFVVFIHHLIVDILLLSLPRTGRMLNFMLLASFRI
jgi:hypothetical protein